MTHPPVEQTMTDDAQSRRLTPKLKRLLFSFIPLAISTFVFAGIPQVLLPLHIGSIDESMKVQNLALASAIAAVGALVTQPLVGAASDRTRSRFGKRAPYLVGGSLAAAVFLVGLSLAHNLLLAIVLWSAATIAYNFSLVAQGTIMPDRVPQPMRGRFAAVIGGSTLVGGLLGSVGGAALSGNIVVGFTVFGVIMAAGAIFFVLVNPDASSRDQVNPPFQLSALVKSLWVSPRKHPDFAWAFASRLALGTGYFVIIGFQLYILQDFIKAGDAAVPLVAALGGINFLATLISIAVAGPLSDRLGRRKIVVSIGAAVTALGMIIPILAPTVPGFMIGVFIMGLGFGAFSSVDTAVIADVLPSSESFGKDIGIISMTGNIPAILAPAIAGLVATTLGYLWVFVLAAVLCVFAAISIFKIKGVR